MIRYQVPFVMALAPLFCTFSPARSPAGFSGPSLTKAAFPCREVWRHKALESASINVKLCSISLKQLSSKYFCPHLKAERAMVFTLGVVRGAEFGYRGVQRAALAQQSDQSKLQGGSGEGSAWQGARLGPCTLLKHCLVQCLLHTCVYIFLSRSSCVLTV